MRVILTAILLLLIFSGCTSQKVVVKKELLCFDLQEVDSSNDVKVRVFKDDIELFEARSYELKSIIEFHNRQIQKYKMECEK